MFDTGELSQRAHIEMGQSPDSNYVSDNLDIGMPFLQGNAEFSAVYPVPKYSCTQPMKVCKKGDLLISVRAPVGEINIADQDYCIGRGLAAIRFQDVPPVVAKSLLEHAKSQLRKVAQGSTFEAINKNNLAELKIVNIPEQELSILESIASNLETQIRETETIIAKLQQVKQGLLHDLLTRGVDENGELRPSYEDAPELYKSSELGWIPKDWVVLELGSIASRSGGFIQTGPFGSQLHAHEYVDEGIPVVMPQDLCGEYIDGIKAAKITEERAQALLKHRFEENDVVFSRRGDLSRCAAISFQVGWVCGTGCLLVRLPKTVMLSSYLSIIYKQQWIQKQVLGMAVGSTMANLNTSILSRLLVTKPNVDEQAEIMTRCSTLESRLKSEEVKLSKLNTLKSGLMDDLLTGKKRVTDLLKQQAN